MTLSLQQDDFFSITPQQFFSEFVAVKLDFKEIEAILSPQ